MNQGDQIGQVAEDLKSSGIAEQVLDDTKERVRTFKEEADEYGQENQLIDSKNV